VKDRPATQTNKSLWLTSAALYVFSQILFLVNIQFPVGYDFDEFHYVPAAKRVLQAIETQNWEHPPLGKEIMAVGLWLFGDRPIGWRFMSTMFGAWTLVAVFLWAFALFRDKRIALWAALLTLVNQLLYVQARIGMLDTFMVAFIFTAMAAFTAAWNASYRGTLGTSGTLGTPGLFSQRTLLKITGVCLGLATCCKWFGVIAWALCAGMVALVHLFRQWNVTFGEKGEIYPDDWYSPELFKNIRPRDWLIYLGVLPIVVYYIPFIPFFFLQNADHSLWDVLGPMQMRMWDGQGRVVTAHPYMSHWMDWPTIKRPIWYAFDKEGVAPHDSVRGVLLLGNPFVLWTGLVALAPCLWGWLVDRRRDAFFIVAAYGAFFFSWMLIPRKISFFYYYYPAGMVLSFALAYVFFHVEKDKKLFPLPWARWLFLAVATGFFVYFFPISAALRIPADSFRQWMWLSSWI
jgi:dolichyl-phosphate-mannose--protein O-mannosyl transferase